MQLCNDICILFFFSFFSGCSDPSVVPPNSCHRLCFILCGYIREHMTTHIASVDVVERALAVRYAAIN